MSMSIRKHLRTLAVVEFSITTCLGGTCIFRVLDTFSKFFLR
jgi:hypothetical protein